MRTLIKPLSYLVALLLVVGGFGLMTRGNGEDETYEITAYFTKAIGLYPNSDVDVLGVPVGKIKSVEPTGTRVKVVMEINEGQKIPADAFAQIVPISLISDRYIQLAPPYDSGPALQEGDVLDVDRTQIPAELDDVFKQLKKLLDAIEPGGPGEPGALGDLIVALNDTLEDREDDLRGTLTNASDLTRTLAQNQEYITGLLTNLDQLFDTLGDRAGSIGEFNKNFALVLTALSESREDLQATLGNLASATEEVGRLVKHNRKTLGPDLEIGARLAATILKNRASVEKSLEWLPVVAIGLFAAHHPEPILATDVRDNASAKFECETLDTVPEPIREILAEQCRGITGQPGFALPQKERKLDCDKGVRQVTRELRRLEGISLPQVVLDEIMRPLKQHLKKIARGCRDLGDRLSDPGTFLQQVLEDVGGLPPIFGNDDDEASGNAAGSGATGMDIQSAGDVTAWLSGFLGFLGWGS